ncbi:hypothetical protein CCR85_07000 [Rhodothalassium salexigens]|uniref:lipopolysaccharide biosynthesis protein n=1 Tax=Rhodothalassium salexigens TaxID=1086 RepID=UPI001912D580|nr:oligosaccharide flippase family protein [Rhodothalassium salexigens]MBK5911240.1 hypothetical protein [Rhodothalassium salexigens]
MTDDPPAPPPAGATDQRTARVGLLRAGAWSLVLKAGNLLLGLGLSVALARLMGPTAYGHYAFALAIVMMLALLARLGLPALTLRETAQALARGNGGHYRGIWRWALVAVGVLSGIAAAGAGLVAVTLDGVRAQAVLAGLALVPLVALLRLADARARGQGRILAGQIPDGLLRPALLLTLALAAAAIAGPTALTPSRVIAGHALAAGIALAVGLALLRRDRPAGAALAPVFEHRRWARAVLPLGLIAGLQVVNMHADLILLGLFRPAEEVGLYRVAAQAALLIGAGQQALNMVTTPQFARLAAADDRPGLQRVATLNARLAAALSLPVAALFVLGGEAVLAALFGAKYAPAAGALAILCLGQVASAAVGGVGHLLNMTGNEAVNARTLAAAMTLNLALNLALIPAFGMVGAATATTLSLALLNALLWRAARARVGVRCDPF